MSAETEIQSFYQRWQNLEERKRAVADDLKELFSETKHAGFENKALRIAFNAKAKAENETDADRELAAIVDVYLSALEAPRASRVCVRENIEEFDAETGEILEDNPHSGATPPSPGYAVVTPDAATDETSRNTGLVANQPEKANEVPAQDGGGTGLGESLSGKSNAARPASVDAHVNDGRLAGQVSDEVVTVVGTESGTVATINERCRNPSGCKFSTHPQKITCSTCASAWLESKKRERELA